MGSIRGLLWSGILYPGSNDVKGLKNHIEFDVSKIFYFLDS